jgi:hypothetical protein
MLRGISRTKTRNRLLMDFLQFMTEEVRQAVLIPGKRLLYS